MCFCSLCGNRPFLCSQKSGSLEKPSLVALGKRLLLLRWLGWWPLLYFSGRLCWRWVVYKLCSRFIVFFKSIFTNDYNQADVTLFKTFRWKRENSLVSVIHFKFPVQACLFKANLAHTVIELTFLERRILGCYSSLSGSSMISLSLLVLNLPRTRAILFKKKQTCIWLCSVFWIIVCLCSGW